MRQGMFISFETTAGTRGNLFFSKKHAVVETCRNTKNFWFGRVPHLDITTILAILSLRGRIANVPCSCDSLLMLGLRDWSVSCWGRLDRWGRLAGGYGSAIGHQLTGAFVGMVAFPLLFLLNSYWVFTRLTGF